MNPTKNSFSMARVYKTCDTLFAMMFRGVVGMYTAHVPTYYAFKMKFTTDSRRYAQNHVLYNNNF